MIILESKRSRIRAIENSNNNTVIAPFSEVYRNHAKSSLNVHLAKDLVDKAYFSSFPSAKEDAASALSALTMNNYNVAELRQSGSLGAIIEMLRQLPSNCELNDSHVSNLIKSMHIITEEISIQQKLLTSPHAIPCIIRLCVDTSGRMQEMSFQILERLSALQDGISRLVEHNIIENILSPQLLTRNSTYLTTRHQAAQMINRIASIFPSRFQLDLFDSVAVDSDGDTRIIDGYIEVQLLSATMSYLYWLSSGKKYYHKPLRIFQHLIKEVISESFENLDHLILILKILSYISKSTKLINYLIDKDLGVALQYVVRTDFEVWRKRIDPFKSKTRNKNIEHNDQYHQQKSHISNKSKKSILTLAIKNEVNTSRRLDDVNFITTKLVVQIYESVIDSNTSIIPDIVSSGLIPGLIFRVGKGVSRDTRYCYIVNHFVYQILTIVSNSSLDNKNNHVVPMSSNSTLISMYSNSFHRKNSTEFHDNLSESSLSSTTTTTTSTKKKKKKKDDDKDEIEINPTESHILTSKLAPILNSPSHLQESQLRKLPTLKQPSVMLPTNSVVFDLRSITNILHAHNVTDLLTEGLEEDFLSANRTHIESLKSLTLLHFRVVRDKICTIRTLSRICAMTLNLSECFFVGLELLCQAVTVIDEKPELLGILVRDIDFIAVLIKALKLSRWLQQIGEIVFGTLAKLSTHSDFRDRVKYFNGISVIVFEIDRRRHQKSRQGQRRARETENPEEFFTEVMLANLRWDWAAVKIQSLIRSFRARKLVGKTFHLLGRQITGLVELQGTSISYNVALIFNKQKIHNNTQKGSVK